MEDSSTRLWTGVAIIAVIYVIKRRFDPLNAIPTIGGSSWPVLSFFSAINFSLNSKKYIQEGYTKYFGSAFKVPLLDNWMIIVSGRDMIEELRRRPDEELSFMEGVADTMQIKYTFGPDTEDDPYHIDVIKEKLTRSVPAILPHVIDELTLAVPQHIPANENDWLEVPVMKAMLQIVARASSRVFVGTPLCRNQEYLDLSISFTIDIVKDKTLVRFFPEFMRPLVGRLSSSVRATLRRSIPHLKPELDRRRENMAKWGDEWPDKPNDLLQWIMDAAQTRDYSDEGIARRILIVNFAAIHTSSNSVCHAIFHLAERPDHVELLREEIESILKEEGWTKNAMGRMWKLDSFLRESQRFNGIGLASLTRKALKDVTLHDGTRIPRGAIVMAAADATHHDETLYANADVFDPFRFSRLRASAEGEGTKHQFVNTSLEYIAFGHGKHACPGRFFAANELKALLAFIILNYDLKLGGDGQRPANLYWGLNVVPAPSGKVLFRKRAVPA
ncbi:cytochrome P450 [Trametes elegans]|nr:cytochrome P450 [Trametes elegans]